MNKTYIADNVFKGKDFSENGLPTGDYENCAFSNCIFSNTDLSAINFYECKFESCDFSMSKISNTSFKDVTFKNSKLLGLHFDECNDFLLSFEFENCILNFSSFYKLKLKKIKFKDCKIQEVDFTESNLTDAIFNNCDLNGAIFGNTILENADFRTSYSFSIDPEVNRIKKAKFSMAGIAGLLDKYDILITWVRYKNKFTESK